jgi:hypothetical protein
MADEGFDRCDDEDEDYMSISSSLANASQFGDEEGDMNTFPDALADALFVRRM